MFAAIDWTGFAATVSALGVIVLAIVKAFESRSKAMAEIRLAEIALAVETLKSQSNTHTVDLSAVKENVQKIETATNSMKDALVVAVGDARLAEGKAIGRAEQKAETGIVQNIAGEGGT